MRRIIIAVGVMWICAAGLAWHYNTERIDNEQAKTMWLEQIQSCIDKELAKDEANLEDVAFLIALRKEVSEISAVEIPQLRIAVELLLLESIRDGNHATRRLLPSVQ